MATSWKHPIHQGFEAPAPIPVLSAKTAFAVDASGSTSGHIMDLQKKFVFTMASHKQTPTPSVTMWGNKGSDPLPYGEASYYGNLGGTQPERMFENKKVTLSLQESDLWYLLTDGEVFSPEAMPRAMIDHGLQNMPVVFLITNRLEGSGPSKVNISVGVGAFAQAKDALVLFKATTSGEIYLIAAKGAFECMLNEYKIDMNSWASLRCFRDNNVLLAAIESVKVPKARDRVTTAEVSLGKVFEDNHHCLVNVERLLEQRQLNEKTLIDLLEPTTFENLLLICKTRSLTGELRMFLLAYKKSVTTVLRDDKAGAGKIMAKIQGIKDEKQIAALQRHLRDAHRKNTEHYRIKVAEAKKNTSPVAPLIDKAIAEVTEMEKSTYSANILDRRSNRAMRAKTVNLDELQMVEDLVLDEDTPAYRGECSICADENEIMSFALKETQDAPANTTDFSLNFPLAAGSSEHNQNVLSSQFICFSCATAIQPMSGTIFKEKIIAVIPTVSHVGINKKFLHDRLALAFTGGLQTGQSGIAQIFIAHLHSVLRHKAWAASAEGDDELQSRRAGLKWLLNDLLLNVKCRETFDETGPWVTFDKAISWAVNNFSEEGINSFIIRYPVTGMLQLFEFYKQLNPDAKVPAELKPLKLLYELVTTFMSRMIKTPAKGTQKQILNVIYSAFNAEGVPVDLGDKTIISDHKIVWKFLHGWFGSSAMQHFVDSVENKGSLVHAIQVVAFTLARETQHQTPKGFLVRASMEDVILNTAITKPSTLPVKMSSQPMKDFFPPHTLKDDVNHIDTNSATIPLFATSYGPSCLACGTRTCNFRFDKSGTDALSIRNERAKHLSKVYAVADSPSISTSGLPEPTGFLKKPTTHHINLHSSIVREWHALSTTDRRAVLADYQLASKQVSHDKFIDGVINRICTIDRRGNIYQKSVKEEIGWVLPSFFEAVHREAVWEGVDDAAFEHQLDQSKNSLEFRIGLELKVLKLSD